MVSVDSSVFFQIINFLLLVWILNLVLFKPIREIVAQRQDKITGLENGIQEQLDQAANKNKTFENGIKDARTKGLQAKTDLIQAAQDREKEIIEQINLKNQNELKDVRAGIKKEAQNASDRLMQQVDEFAAEIGQKILGRSFYAV